MHQYVKGTPFFLVLRRALLTNFRKNDHKQSHFCNKKVIFATKKAKACIAFEIVCLCVFMSCLSVDMDLLKWQITKRTKNAVVWCIYKIIERKSQFANRFCEIDQLRQQSACRDLQGLVSVPESAGPVADCCGDPARIHEFFQKGVELSHHCWLAKRRG